MKGTGSLDEMTDKELETPIKQTLNVQR